jgi:hypothetical protein
MAKRARPLPWGAEMLTHVPTQHAGYPAHHLLRNALIAIGVVVVAIIVVAALILVRDGASTTATSATEAERMIEFRAGERAEWTAPLLAEDQRLIEFRAGERAEWVEPVP